MAGRKLFAVLFSGLIAGCASCDRKEGSAAAQQNPQPTPTPQTTKGTDMNTAKSDGKIDMTEAQWRQKLTPEQYNVLREKGTERAFTGKYWDTKTPGVYKCAGCGTVLFTSGDKFDSGCGWPSFDKMAAAGVVKENKDTSHGMIRTEVVCAKCGGHLGHVFDDGPTDTHLRYCINSASIELEKQDDAKDAAPKK
jgi:peptide-methionine (R)-S-oxide reductase